MLIPRQVDMIMYLLNRGDWCSSEELCGQFHMAKNTLVPELKRIQEELKDGLVLETGRRGYRLTELSGAALSQVHDHLVSYGDNKSIDIRPASILLYLLYLRQPITVRELSEVFYLSKSAIDLELRTIRRWLDNFDGLSLDNSGNQGMRVLGTEQRKRVYCARIGSLKVFHSTPLGEKPKERYAEVLRLVNEIMEQCLSKYGLLISGADFRRIVRLLATAVLRSEMGFDRGEDDCGPEVPPVVEDIAAMATQRLGCHPTETEKWDLWAFLEQSTLLSDPPASEEAELEHAMKERLFAMDQKAAQIMALPDDFRFSGRHYVLQYLEKIYQRYDCGNIQVNNLDARIVLEHPLEVHVASRLFPETFGGHATEESSAIALFLAANLREYKSRMRVLLVTGENRGVIYQLSKAIQSFSYPAVQELKVIPEYAFRQDRNAYAQFEIRLTTEPEIRLMESGFFYVPPILSQQDIYILQDHFRRCADQKHTERIAVQEKALCIQRVQVSEQLSNLEELLGALHGTEQTCHWIRDRVLFVCRMGRQLTHSVTLFDLKTPVTYQRRKVARLVFVQCREGDADLLDLFDYVSDLLKKI